MTNEKEFENKIIPAIGNIVSACYNLETKKEVTDVIDKEIAIIRQIFHSHTKEVVDSIKKWANEEEINNRIFGQDGMVSYIGLLEFLASLEDNKK